jgi:flagellar motility protein MotE (MotC chaperone)
MIGKLLRGSVGFLGYLLVGTMIAQLFALGYGMQRGYLSREKLVGYLEVAYGLTPDRADSNRKSEPERFTLAEIRKLRDRLERDNQLRDQAAAGQKDDLRFMKKNIEEELAYFNRLRDAFTKELTKLKLESEEAGRAQARKTLENLSPELAKNHVMSMAKNENSGLEKAVGLIVNMPIDARKKILEAFRTDDPDEAETFHRIIQMMHDGKPITDLINDTNKQLGGQGRGENSTTPP